MQEKKRLFSESTAVNKAVNLCRPQLLQCGVTSADEKSIIHFSKRPTDPLPIRSEGSSSNSLACDILSSISGNHKPIFVETFSYIGNVDCTLVAKHMSHMGRGGGRVANCTFLLLINRLEKLLLPNFLTCWNCPANHPQSWVSYLQDQRQDYHSGRAGIVDRKLFDHCRH